MSESFLFRASSFRIGRDTGDLSVCSDAVDSSSDSISFNQGSLNGKSYLIIPVVSNIGNSIIWAANSPGPEFLSSSVLSLYPEQRNGRPVVLNHPQNSEGEYISANSSAETLSQWSVGFWQNCRFESNRIKGDLWIEIGKIGENSDLSTLISSIQSGGTSEVSEGNWVLVDGKSGSYNGVEYVQSWILAISDHIAMLSPGIVGACGVISHGCGAGIRRAEMEKGGNINLLNGINRTDDRFLKGVPMSFSGKVSTFLRAQREKSQKKQEEKRFAMFISDLSTKLEDALEKFDEGFIFIDDIDPDAGLVVYCSLIFYGYSASYDSAERKLYMVSYTLQGEEAVIGSDKSEVEVSKVYKPVAVEQTDPSTITAEKTVKMGGADMDTGDGSTATDMMKGKDKMKGMKGDMTAMSESKTTIGEKMVNGRWESNDNPAHACSCSDGDRDWLLKQDIRSLRAMAEKVEKEEKEHRANLIDGTWKILSGYPEPVFSKSDLESMDIEHLTRLNSLVIQQMKKESEKEKVDDPAPSRVAKYDFSGARDTSSGKEKPRAAQLPDPFGLNKKLGMG